MLLCRGALLDRVLLNVMTSRQSILSVSGSANGNQGTLALTYPLIEKKSASLDLRLEFDFSPLLLIVNPKLMNDGALRGIASGVVSLQFLSGQGEFANGRLGLKRLSLAKHGTTFELERPVETRVEGGSFFINQLNLVGNKRTISLSLKSNQSDLDGKLVGNLNFITFGVCHFDDRKCLRPRKWRV